MFKEGDKVAYGNSYGPRGWTVSEVVRLTPTQAVLADGSKVRQSDGAVMGRGLLAKPYEEVKAEVELWMKKEAEYRRLRKEQSAVAELYDEMRRGYFEGFTADELSRVAEAMREAVNSRKSKREKEKDKAATS